MYSNLLKDVSVEDVKRVKSIEGYYEALVNFLDHKKPPIEFRNYYNTPLITNNVYFSHSLFKHLSAIEKLIRRTLDCREKRVGIGITGQIGCREGEYKIYPMLLNEWFMLCSYLSKEVPPTTFKAEFEWVKNNMKKEKGVYHLMKWYPAGKSFKRNDIVLPKLINPFWWFMKYKDSRENIYRSHVSALKLRYSYVNETLDIGFSFGTYTWSRICNCWTLR